MTKITYILLAICCCNVLPVQSTAEINTISSSAETDSITVLRRALVNGSKVTLGLKGGYTHSNLHGDEIDYMFANTQTTNLPSFHVGMVVNSQFGEHFRLKHELLLNQRGAGVALTDSINGGYTGTLTMLYIDLYPMSPTFHFHGIEIYAGPYLSLLADASIGRKDKNGNHYADKSIFGDPSNNESESKYLQKFDFGIAVGIEYQFPFGLSIGARYLYGLTDIFQYANSYTLNDPKTDNIRIYNTALMFSIGYLLTGGN